MLKRFAKNRLSLAIAGWSFILSIYFTEGVARLMDPKRRLPTQGWHDGINYTWGVEVKNNQLGFRERNFAMPKPVDTVRIMVLGDSLTWGTGLTTDERYSNLLEHLLLNRFPEKSIEVVNFGMSGGPTIVERDIADKYFEMVQPDLMIVGFCLNDPQPHPQDWSLEKESFESSGWYQKFENLTETMKSFGLVNLASRLEPGILRLAELWGLVPSWSEALDRTYNKGSKEWASFTKALEDIRDLSAAKGLHPPVLAILNQALKDGRAQDYRVVKNSIILDWYKQVSEAGRDLGLTVVDFAEEIRELDPSTSLVINPIDGHPSKDLNEVYAKKLFLVIEPILADKIGQ